MSVQASNRMLGDMPSSVVNSSCPACGRSGMAFLSTPRPEYVVRCSACGSAFFNFGRDAEGVSHADQYNVDAGYRRYLEHSNESSLKERYKETISNLRTMLADVEHPRLFDVGAGGGNFLARAQASGFCIAGNEISRPAIQACRERFGISLMLGDDLAAIATELGEFDAVTMWCVIAHVDDPKELLLGVRALLRPGGVLFFSTPRYCVIDRVAVLLCRLTGDRYRKVFDRRINEKHRRQYSRRGMEAMLTREGFIPESVKPAVGYGLYMTNYLTAIGIPVLIARPLGRFFEVAARTGFAPRNVLNVYARSI